MATPTSGQQAAQQNGTAKTGGKRKKVASAAGAARYHKPIGSEIGGPRDANHAAIQQDPGARKNYGDLINGDSAKQRQALDGMSPEDLNKLADIAFSFKSSDPKVVALRIAARNAQSRRGIRVPVGQTQTKSSGVRTAAKVAIGSKGAARKGKAPAKKAAPAPANSGMKGRVRAMSNGVGPASQRLVELAAQAPQHTAKTGSFPIPNVNHLRKAVQAIGRAKPEHRPIIARHILARAKALKAEHLVSDHIRHYARGHRQPGTVGMSRQQRAAIELAGKWKHGYIPLDATAMASKMKGGKGKPWWEGGSGHSGGAKKALHGSPKSGSPGSSGKLTNVVKSGSAESKTRGAKVNARTQIARVNMEHDSAVNKAKREGTQPPSFPYHKVKAIQADDAHSKKEAKIAERIASGKGKLTQGVLHPTHKAQAEALLAEGKHKEAGDLVRRSKAESRNRIHALVQKAKPNEPAAAKPNEIERVASGVKARLAPYRQMSPAQLDAKEAELKKRGQTDASVANELRYVRMVKDERATSSRDVAKPTAPPAKEKVTSFDPGTGKTSTRAVVRDQNGKVVGTNKTGSAKSAQTRKTNQQLGAFAPKNQPKVAAGEAKATPTAVRNGERYIQMHGTASARQKVAQLEGRGHLTAPERVQLAGLKAALAGGSLGKA